MQFLLIVLMVVGGGGRRFPLGSSGRKKRQQLPVTKSSVRQLAVHLGNQEHGGQPNGSYL